MSRPSADGVLGTLRRVEGFLLAVLGWALIALLSGMVLVVFLQVLTRYLLDIALIWSEEIARLLFISLIFIGAAVLARRREHLTVTVFVDLLPERFRHLADAIASGVGLVVSWYLVVGAWDTFLREWDQLTPALQFPMGVVFGLILVSVALLFVGLAVTIAQSLWKLARDAPHTRPTDPDLPDPKAERDGEPRRGDGA